MQFKGMECKLNKEMSIDNINSREHAFYGTTRMDFEVTCPKIGDSYLADFFGYVDAFGTAYYSLSVNEDYKKIIDNVVKVEDNYFLTNDGELYKFELEEGLVKITNQVRDIYISSGNIFLKKDDGYIYFTDGYISIFKSEDYPLLVESDVKGFYRLKFENVSSILYKNRQKYVYLNSNNKIEMHTQYDSYVVDNSVESLEKILKFVSN